MNRLSKIEIEEKSVLMWLLGLQNFLHNVDHRWFLYTTELSFIDDNMMALSGCIYNKYKGCWKMAFDWWKNSVLYNIYTQEVNKQIEQEEKSVFFYFSASTPPPDCF